MSTDEVMTLSPYKMLVWCIEHESYADGAGPMSLAFKAMYGIRVRTSPCVAFVSDKLTAEQLAEVA